jgi:thioredoxin 1
MKQWGPVLGTVVVTAVGAGLLTWLLPCSCVHGEPRNSFAQQKGGTTMSVAEQLRALEHVSTAEFPEKVLRSSVPVLVDFYAEWCGPCKALTPILEQFARENPSVKVVKINVDHEAALADHYAIESIPHLIVFRDGRPVAKHSGMANSTTLKKLLLK